jgi:hypothetical protein
MEVEKPAGFDALPSTKNTKKNGKYQIFSLRTKTQAGGHI